MIPHPLKQDNVKGLNPGVISQVYVHTLHYWQTTNNISTKLTNQHNNQSLISSTDVIQLTLILKMTTTQVAEMSVFVNNSPIHDYVHRDDHTCSEPTYIVWKCWESSWKRKCSLVSIWQFSRLISIHFVKELVERIW